MKLQHEDQTYVVNPTFEVNVHISLRRRTLPIIDGHFSPNENLALLEAMLALENAKASARTGVRHALPASLRKHVAVLVATGILVPPDAIPGAIVPDFELAPRLLELVPNSVERSGAELTLDSANVYLQEGTRRPRVCPPGIPPANAFPEGGNLVWVHDPGTRMWAVYRSSKPVFDALRKGMLSKGAEDRIPFDVIRTLQAAQILVDPRAQKQRLTRRQQEVRRSRTTLRREGFAVLKNVLPPLQIAALRAYFRAREEHGYLRGNDPQANRLVAHNDPMLQFVHRQSTALLQLLTPQAILPSYSYLSAYREKADLKRHTDRPQCVWNASVLIDSTRKERDGSGWPIFLETPAGVQEIDLGFGDMVIYSGENVPHWRKQLRSGRQTLGLLHYVPSSFTGDLA